VGVTLSVVEEGLAPELEVVLADAVDAVVADAALLEEELETSPPPHALNAAQAHHASAVSSRVGRFIEQPLQPYSLGAVCFRGKARRAQSVAGTRPCALCDVTDLTVFEHAIECCEYACGQAF